MVMLTFVCIWHGITTVLVRNGVTRITTYDTIALLVAASSYVIFNVIFPIRVYSKVRFDKETLRITGY